VFLVEEAEMRWGLLFEEDKDETVKKQHYFLRCKRTKALIGLMALAGLLGLSQLVMAQAPVYFADANLKAAVESQLGISDPTPTDMRSLTSLDTNNSGIEDLTGIEYATNLSTLYLSPNQISDISALSGLVNLTHLWLDYNQVSDISTLAEMTNLMFLDSSVPTFF